MAGDICGYHSWGGKKKNHQCEPPGAARAQMTGWGWAALEGLLEEVQAKVLSQRRRFVAWEF